ncbi:MAG: hypothetical protein FJY82_06730, partial [Candidatus Aminicenantes bacterium]|nr:hypothetical protein [Candidatus Aminicenantes bacterium]
MPGDRPEIARFGLVDVCASPSIFPAENHAQDAQPKPDRPGIRRLNPLERRLRDARDKAVAAILRLQREDGSWDVPCETDPSPTAYHLLLRRYLGRPDAGLEAGLAAYIRFTARPEGGWAAYPGGPADPDITALCYAALKAAGMPADDALLKKAARAFSDSGGWDATTYFGRLMPAFLGQIPLPSLPYLTPALLTLPRWLPVHPDRQPMHVRTTIIPLAFLLRNKCIRPLRPNLGMGEFGGRRMPRTIWSSSAWPSFRTRWLRRSAKILGRLSRWIDAISPPADWGKQVLNKLSGIRNSDGTLGGFFLSTVLALMALDNIREPRASELLDQGLDGLEGWIVSGPRGLRQQILPSANGDTAVALQALQAAGLPPDSPEVRRPAAWLLRNQCRRYGPWANRLSKRVRPGGWAFGFETDLFPECDTTSIVLRALLPVRDRYRETFDRGAAWLLAFQDRSGGWAAWDRGNKKQFLFPSEAFVSYQDLPDSEITARVLFVLGPLARDGGDGRLRTAVRKGVIFLWRSQRPDGSWAGHWVESHAAGTGHALQGLAAASVPPGDCR